MYGRAILSKDCRISINDIKRVLGLIDSTAMDIEEPVGEFLAMVNEDDQSSSSSGSSEHSQTPLRSGSSRSISSGNRSPSPAQK